MSQIKSLPNEKVKLEQIFKRISRQIRIRFNAEYFK